jgi:hypothetical protein
MNLLLMSLQTNHNWAAASLRDSGRLVPYSLLQCPWGNGKGLITGADPA